MEINITRFVRDEDPFNYSASRWEYGNDAPQATWHHAMQEGERAPLLTTPEDLEALRDHMRGYGAWDEDEIAAWSEVECNALFIQLVSGDMREAGMDECDLENFDWEEYERRAHDGQISGNISLGGDGQIYYYLGD